MKIKKVLLINTFIGAISIMSIAPVFAVTNDINTVGTTNVPVTATIDSQFTVTIPKSLDLSSNTAIYEIGISGDLDSSKVLKILPTEAIKMTEANAIKQSVNATVTQTKKDWSYTDIASATKATGTISSNLSAGSWEGILKFNVLIAEQSPISINMYHGSMENEPEADVKELPNEMTIKEFAILSSWTATDTSVADTDGCKLYKYLGSNKYEEVIDTNVLLLDKQEFVFK